MKRGQGCSCSRPEAVGRISTLSLASPPEDITISCHALRVREQGGMAKGGRRGIIPIPQWVLIRE